MVEDTGLDYTMVDTTLVVMVEEVAVAVVAWWGCKVVSALVRLSRLRELRGEHANAREGAVAVPS